MLKNTFCHIPGIGAKTEDYLWRSGILSWDNVNPQSVNKIRRISQRMLLDAVASSHEHYSAGDLKYFETQLPNHLMWRIFSEFRHQTVYLDIETNGLDPYYGMITTISMYDGRHVFCYVNGDNLEDFMTDIEKYRVIITYNGKTFDIPFIKNYFGIDMDHTHIDLRYVLAGLGYKGGLKNVERMMGIDRGELTGVDGYFAVLLWNEYQLRGNRAALDTLLSYNIEDVINLETLMVMAYNKYIENTPFHRSHQLVLPEKPQIPVKPDMETIYRIKHRLFA